VLFKRHCVSGEFALYSTGKSDFLPRTSFRDRKIKNAGLNPRLDSDKEKGGTLSSAAFFPMNF